jgi:hypothetical protein
VFDCREQRELDGVGLGAAVVDEQHRIDLLVDGDFERFNAAEQTLKVAIDGHNDGHRVSH